MKSRWAWMAGVFPASLVVIVTLALLPDAYKPPNERHPPAAAPAEAAAPRPPAKPWRIGFELAKADAGTAAYALENRAGVRAAIALECSAGPADRPELETCQAEIPAAFNGGDVRLVRLVFGDKDFASEWLPVPPSR